MENYFDKPIEVLKMSVPSIVYTFQNNLEFVALSNLSAAVYQVFFFFKPLFFHECFLYFSFDWERKIYRLQCSTIDCNTSTNFFRFSRLLFSWKSLQLQFSWRFFCTGDFRIVDGLLSFFYSLVLPLYRLIMIYRDLLACFFFFKLSVINAILMIDSIINHFKGIKNQIKTRNNFYFIFIILFINFFIFL